MSDEQARAVYRYIEINPGQCANRVARGLNMPYSVVCNAIVMTEKLGLLLYEEKGRLYVWQDSASAWRTQHREP